MCARASTTCVRLCACSDSLHIHASYLNHARFSQHLIRDPKLSTVIRVRSTMIRGSRDPWPVIAAYFIDPRITSWFDLNAHNRIAPPDGPKS